MCRKSSTPTYRMRKTLNENIGGEVIFDYFFSFPLQRLGGEELFVKTLILTLEDKDRPRRREPRRVCLRVKHGAMAPLPAYLTTHSTAR